MISLSMPRTPGPGRRGRWRHLVLVCVAGALATLSAPARAVRPIAAPPADAAPAGAPGPAAAREPDSLDQDTPRRALERFLGNARAGELYQAADDLEQTSVDTAEMAQLARKLAAVLDRRMPLDAARLQKISDAPGGNKDDGSESQDEIGRIDTPLGPEPVRLHRTLRGPNDPHWVFSRRTVERIQSWYQLLPDRWVLDNMPESLLITGPLGLLLWQWLALPVLLLVSVTAGLLGALAVLLALRPLLASRPLGAAILAGQRGPLRLVFGALTMRVLLATIYLTAPAEQSLRALTAVVLVVGLCFGLWRAADTLAEHLRDSPWLRTRPGLLGVLPLAHRLLGLLFLALAVMGSLQELGFSVASLIAGLGLGGLAVALAAKTSLEHLLGGVTLSLDQPMRVGDAVKVGDVNGTVEQIGIRSTRLRTADRSLVTIPNGKLADMQIETLAARDRMRMALVLNIVFSLRAARLRELRQALTDTVRAQPLVWPDKIRVHYTGLTDAALTIELVCFFQTSDPDQFLEARSDLILSLLEVIESFGATAALAKQVAAPRAPAQG